MRIQILKELISNIISEMFFLYEETPPDYYQNLYDFAVDFDCAYFSIQLYLNRNLAELITTNFIGVDTASDEDILDVLKELMNMVVGNFSVKIKHGFEGLLPIPISRKLEQDSLIENDTACEYLFYNDNPIKILYKEK